VLARFGLYDEGMEDAIVVSGTAAFRTSGKSRTKRGRAANRSKGADAS
jgi:hypothetical protein